MKELRTDVVVIGGGAAGMLAAATAARAGRKVILLEKNRRLGKKLRITGKGRCNVTNHCDVNSLVSNLPSGGRFMYGSFSRFGPADIIRLLESLGVSLKTERGNRVFPVSDRADSVADAMERYVRDSGVKIIQAAAKEILTEDGAVRGVSSDAGVIECSSAVICTGGLSYPGTGSTGDGYKMAKALGHRVNTPGASLVPLVSPDSFCSRMQGFSLRNVTLSAYENGAKRIFSELGEMLFTHYGVSGPLVLSASAHMRDFQGAKYHLSVDLKPGLDEKKLDQRILRDFDKYKNRDFKHALGDLAGRSMIPVLIERSGIDGETKVNSITRKQRAGLVSLFKDFRISISGPRPISEAIITTGGVDLGEADPRTMESKLVSGLFFAGEVLDVDGYTGGFNLQVAWSTAYTAGTSV